MFEIPDSINSLRKLIDNTPAADMKALKEARHHQSNLTKPPGSLGKLEEIVEWLAMWQGRHPPSAEHIQIIVFAANHGVSSLGVSAFPSSVTAQMVNNFAAGGAAINQLSNWTGASLNVVPINLETPTANITREPALSESMCLKSFNLGMKTINKKADLICLGEMGIGNTTVASAIAAALFGGTGAQWVGRGTGIDDTQLIHKSEVIDTALKFHRNFLSDPIQILIRLGGHEFAAIAGATLAARFSKIPVILDGFASTTAASILEVARPDSLSHCLVSHKSAEKGHSLLLKKIQKQPLLDLSLRLGEGTGAALAAGLVSAAVATHNGMSTFSEAGISGPNP